MKIIATFQTVEHFWRVYDHLIRPNEFKFTTDYHLFKEVRNIIMIIIIIIIIDYYYHLLLLLSLFHIILICPYVRTILSQGVKPTWEDPANKQGGKWMIRLKKGLASSYWEEIVLAIIGEQFDVGNEICGAVCR